MAGFNQVISSDNIHTLAFVGHGGSGKTSLVEALLHTAGAIPAKGSVEKGTTVSDSDPLEKSFGHSLNSALTHFGTQSKLVHVIDTPGYPDFIAQGIAALAAVDTAIIVINAQNGIEPVTERMMALAEARGLCRMLVINKIDADNLNLPGLVAEIRERFGKACMLLDLPAHNRKDVVEVLEHDQSDSDFDSVASAHRALIDQLVEEDEELMARYLEEGTDPSPDELHAPFEKALREGHLIPILFTSARTGAGVKELLDALVRLAPNPAEGNPPPFFKGEPGSESMETFKSEPDPNKHVLAHVFKVAIDPYLGRVCSFRVYQGTVKKDAQLFVGDGKRPIKVGHLYRCMGKDLVEVEALQPGELGAIAKVDEITFDCVLHDSHDEDHIHLKPLEFPRPMYGLAVETRKKGDEQRLFDILHKLEVEDPCFQVERNPTTHETVIRGLGDLHMRTRLELMSSRYKLEVDTRPPRIPYRETITKGAEGHHRHKKQTGGAGQFGEVYLRVEPLERGAGFQFVDAVKGGTIPGVFIPAVEKGARMALIGGIVAGYPVEDVRVTVYDGKTHPVDGKEVAFITAGKLATIQAVLAANPIVLEPIVKVEVLVPESSFGDIAGDLSSRRGHLTGTHQRARGQVALLGEVPLGELSDYQSRIKSLTGDQASYTMEFSHFAPVPPNVQKDLAGKFQLKTEEE